MNLNTNNKNKIRKYIEKITKEIPDGERLIIDEKILDDLIFFKSNGQKIPVWTGSFLKKIDLSRISFENTILSFASLEDYNPLTYRELLGQSELEDFEYEYEKCNGKSFLSAQYDIIKAKQKGKSKYIFDFSGTNININFNDLACKNAISDCDFSGVDLSKSNINLLKIITNCNLSNSGIKIDFKGKSINNCDLSNNDLSDKEIEINIGNLEIITDNDLSKTGLNIKVNQNYISIGGQSLICGRKTLGKYINETINLIQLGIIKDKGLMLKKMTLNDKIQYLENLGIIRYCKLVNKEFDRYEIVFDNEVLINLLHSLVLGRMKECYINGEKLEYKKSMFKK